MVSRLFSFLSNRRGRGTGAMWLLVGLGNPGREHQDQRHNIGFMAIDEIAREYGFPAFKKKFDGELSEGRIAGQRVALLKPMTYMNVSGQSVGPAAKYFKVTPNQVIVFHDELDLPPGKLRVKKGGGHGGHNGLKSTDAHMNTQDYWRVRLGIGHPGDKDRVTGYVLGNFSKEEQKWLPDWMRVIAKETPLLLDNKHSDFMTIIARDFSA